MLIHFMERTHRHLSLSYELPANVVARWLSMGWILSLLFICYRSFCGPQLLHRYI